MDDDPSGIELDGEFGEVGIRALNKFQEAHGGKATGDFDVDTRTDFEEELGITLDNLALIGEGTTVFVQPDGSKIMWSSTIGLMASA